jgi:arylsulfatase
MIAQWPGKITPGTETDLISAFYDVLPTFCEISGVEVPNDVDGKSFLPTLLGKENQEKHEFLYWEFPESGGQQAVRMGKWKGIRKNIKKDSLQVQLYNLEDDIQELNDVSSQNPEIVKEIETIFKNEHEMAEMEKFQMKALDK